MVGHLCARLISGLGVVPGVNLNREYPTFETVHESALDVAEQNVINLLALIMGGATMLRRPGKVKTARKIRAV